MSDNTMDDEVFKYSIIYDGMKHTTIINRSTDKAYNTDINYKNVVYLIDAVVDDSVLKIDPFGAAVYIEVD